MRSKSVSGPLWTAIAKNPPGRSTSSTPSAGAWSGATGRNADDLAGVLGEELVAVRRSRGGRDAAGDRVEQAEGVLAPRPDPVPLDPIADAVRTERGDEPVFDVERGSAGRQQFDAARRRPRGCGRAPAPSAPGASAASPRAWCRRAPRPASRTSGSGIRSSRSRRISCAVSHLGGLVAPVAGRRVDRGRREQADLVVVVQRFHAQMGEAGELADWSPLPSCPKLPPSGNRRVKHDSCPPERFQAGSC